MKRLFLAVVAWISLAGAPAAFAEFHLFQIEQLYSNADGTVQFIVMREVTGTNGEHVWAGHALTSTRAGVSKVLVFPANLPSSATANKRVLIATDGFAALGILARDYAIPAGFLPTDGGTLNYAGVDQMTFGPLPTNGSALTRTGAMIPNVATNFAGSSASVPAAPAPPADFTPVAGLWANPNELGTGYTLDFKHGVLVVAIYAYLPNGTAQWYLASGAVTNNVFAATLDKYVNGQCISCAFNGQPMLNGNDGNITITFTSNTSATVNLPGGRVTTIAPFVF